MSKTVGQLKRMWDAAVSVSLTNGIPYELSPAIAVLLAYGAKNRSSKEKKAISIANKLELMLLDSSAFGARLFEPNTPLSDYFIMAIKQSLGIVDPKAPITRQSLSNRDMTMAQLTEITEELFLQAEETTFAMQKQFLGVIISYHINKLILTAGNSGFASACFVIAKELKLQNISPFIWLKMINAANFSASFLERGTSNSRRAAELRSIYAQLPHETRDRMPPPYHSAEQPYPRQAPPPYPWSESNRHQSPPEYSPPHAPDELPPAWEDEETVLETMELPHGIGNATA